MTAAPVPVTVAPAPTRRFLPAGWAVVAMLAGYPVWWLLGLGGFIWLVLAVPMAAWLIAQRRILLPRGFALYAVFLCFVAASVIRIDNAERMAGYLVRASWYLAAAVLWLYLANTEHKLATRRIVSAVVVLWLASVAGGWLGLLFPLGGWSSPVSLLLPGKLLANELVNSMVIPGFAEIQDSYTGFLTRPKAPYFYTNGWGSAMALLTPFAIGALTVPGIRPSPRIIKIGLAASVVPIVLSLNRGLWMLLVLGVLYTVVRRSPTSRTRGLAVVMMGLALVAVVVVATPLGDPVRDALSSRAGDSNERRTVIYEETFERTAESPILGWGGPRPSERTEQSVGTHGQVWNVMFSHGFLAVGLYVAMLVSLVWRTRNPATPLGMAMHVVLLLGLLESLFYGQIPHQLFILVTAAAVAYRDAHETAGATGLPASG